MIDSTSYPKEAMFYKKEKTETEWLSFKIPYPQ